MSQALQESVPTATPSAAAQEDADPRLPERVPQERPPRFRRLFGLLAPYRGRFVLATLFLFLGSGIGLVYPQAARYAIDAGSLDVLDQVAFGLLALILLQAACTWLRHYLMSWLGERAVTDMRRRVMERLVRLPPAWFEARHTGELVGRIAGDVTILEGVVGSELSMALRNGVQLLGGLTLLLVVDPALTASMLLIIPPMVIAVMLFSRRIRRMSRAVQDAVAETSTRVQEVLGAIHTVQAFRQEEAETARYRDGIEIVFRRALDLSVWRATFMATSSLSGFLAFGVVLYLGGRRVAAGSMSAGDLTAFLLYTLIVAVALASLTSLWAALQRAAGATARLFEVIEEIPAIASPAEPRAPISDPRGIRFRRVDFRYPTRRDVEVLHGIDLDIAPGETVAFVGPSGAGKTSLTGLVPRFYDVSQGTVEVGGVDVRAQDLEALRGRIAIVPQDPVLFSGTIAENIAYGRPDATPQQIEAAAREAHADAFIRAFPEGYETPCGERGVQLSGGQRQRVAIARALLTRPEILILDEATSSLDAESEALVQQALERLMRGRTTLVIAHRLSTVRDADRIVVLDAGRIAEEGTHGALLERDGLYRSLVHKQLQ